MPFEALKFHGKCVGIERAREFLVSFLLNSSHRSDELTYILQPRFPGIQLKSFAGVTRYESAERSVGIGRGCESRRARHVPSTTPHTATPQLITPTHHVLHGYTPITPMHHAWYLVLQALRGTAHHSVFHGLCAFFRSKHRKGTSPRQVPHENGRTKHCPGARRVIKYE